MYGRAIPQAGEEYVWPSYTTSRLVELVGERPSDGIGRRKKSRGPTAEESPRVVMRKTLTLQLPTDVHEQVVMAVVVG